MFNQVSPPEKAKGLSAPAKLIVISVASVLLGFGLCSAGGGWFVSSASVMFTIGAIAFWGGLIGLGVGVFWWLVQIITRS